MTKEDIKVHKIDLCGREEFLPVLSIAKGVSIAFLNLHGNVDLTEFCAAQLANKLSGAEVILTAESKGLQLAHCVARNLGHKFYAVARKTKKLYMQDGIETEVKSITTAERQHLYLSKRDAELLKGKKVAIVDDVISTGGILCGLEKLVSLAGGELVCKACVLVEGDSCERGDIVSLGKIPIFRE